MKILVIAGHQNIKNNSIVSLRGNTGTAGELEINVRIADRLSFLLRQRGFEVTQSDANANDNPTIKATDYNLAIALHCDMDVQNDQGGGMVGSGDKSVDAMWQESLRIKGALDEVYFSETKIVNKKIVTNGMKFYYMWQYLTSKTPCVLIEMGQAKDPHDSVLLGNTELIAGAISKSICKAFNVPEVPVVTPEPPVDLKPVVDKLTKENEDLTKENTAFKDKLSKIKEKVLELNQLLN